MRLKQGLPGNGSLMLIGGGEFSFGETLEVDRLWVDQARPGKVGFLPAASGSSDYAQHFATYLRDAFDREVETLPIYRPRDARRGRNLDRISACSAVYIGGGIADQLLETLADSPALYALEEGLRSGAVVTAIAAAAQALGQAVRSLRGHRALPGLGWLSGWVVEPNFDPGHDRRLRWLVDQEGVEGGFGLPAGSAVLFRPHRSVTTLGTVFRVGGPDGDLHVLGQVEDSNGGAPN